MKGLSVGTQTKPSLTQHLFCNSSLLACTLPPPSDLLPGQVANFPSAPSLFYQDDPILYLIHMSHVCLPNGHFHLY